ncbi:hypothetical protein Tco_0635974 [Tanacetum coccineum]
MLLVGGENENVPLYYHMYEKFQIQFRREEFCLVTRLKFGVEYSDDYDDKDKHIPFRRRVFPSRLDGKRITGKDVEELIDSNSFKKIDDDDAVSLCCIGILQLVLLGLEDRRPVPNWILRDANVKCWLPLYATESTNEDDKKTYSLLGFTWAFKSMADSINDARKTIVSNLQRELEAETTLANTMLGNLTRYSEQIRTREIQITMLQNMPTMSLNSYGLHALLMTHEADIRTTNNLIRARQELLRSIAEKQNFINNYRAI